MLKKLFAHEWKDTWKLMTIVNAAMILYALIGMIIFNQKNVDTFFEGSGRGNSLAPTIGFFSYFLVYAIGIVVLSVLSLLYFFVRFYRNLYTDQGYLMHTLPVESSDLLISKAAVAMIWRGICILVCCIAVIMLLYSMGGPEAWGELVNAFREIHMSSGQAILVIILILLGIVGSLAFDVSKGYAAISIGQQMGKNKVLWCVGCYIGLNVLVSLITNIVTETVTFSLVRMGETNTLANLETAENTVLLIFLIIDLAMLAASAGLYALSNHFMKNKLNLD